MGEGPSPADADADQPVGPDAGDPTTEDPGVASAAGATKVVPRRRAGQEAPSADGSRTAAGRTADRAAVGRPDVADVVGLLFVVGGFCLGVRPLFDNSLFTHIATGRLILESGIPHQDPYSFTASGQPWVVQSWLASLAYGLVERAAGGIGLRLFAGVLLALLMALVWRLTKPAGGLLARVAIAALFLLSSSAFLSPRPVVFGLVLLALSLLVVTEARDPRWLVPIMWVWVNSHGSFPLGLVAIAAVIAGGWLDGQRDRSNWRPVLWALGGTALGALNPLGPVLLTFPVTLLGRMEILSRVVEWQSPSFSESYARLFLVYTVIAVLALVRRPSYRAALPLVVFVGAALLGQRNIPIAALVMIPGLSSSLAGLGENRGVERGLVPRLAAVAVVAAGVVVAANVLAQPSFDLNGYPVDAIRWLAQEDLIGPSHRVATEDTAGNTLELLYGAGAGTFFDDRYDMYPLDLSKDYLLVNGGLPGWQDALDRHDVHYVMWSRTGPLAQLVAQSPDWRIRYQDATTFVACRRDRALSDC
jgi:hypothetical protein